MLYTFMFIEKEVYIPGLLVAFDSINNITLSL